MDKNWILLVDDDETLLSTFKNALEMEGYSVETATTGREALDKTKEKKFYLLILDIKLPDIMGDEVAKTLREQNYKGNIVFITGYPDLQKSIDALDLGIYEILLKPISPEEILRVVREQTKR